MIHNAANNKKIHTKAEMEDAIGEQLARLGWKQNPGGVAIALKDYETAVGIREAQVYLADFGPSETAFLLRGQYDSQGSNALEGHPFSVPKFAGPAEIHAIAASFAFRADSVIKETYAARLHRKEPTESSPSLNQRVLLIGADGTTHISRWVGDGQVKDGKAVYPHGRPQSGMSANKWAPLPTEDDPRWRRTPPPLDTAVLTLSPFQPSGRLDVAIESKQSQPLMRHPNHPPFSGIQGWMPIAEVTAGAQPLPAWQPEQPQIRRMRLR